MDEVAQNPLVPIMQKSLSFKYFIISQVLILIVGLLFLGGLYYILTIQNQKPTDIYSPTGRPITTAPSSLSLNLTSPSDDMLIFQPVVLISGETSPNLNLLITTDSQDLILKSDFDGSFSTTLDLDEGVNNIRVIVFDDQGEKRQEKKTVYYSKEKI